MTISRRSLLAGAAGVGAAWLTLDLAVIEEALAHAGHTVRQAPPPPFRTLTPDEAADLSAVASRIVPTTDNTGRDRSRCDLLHRSCARCRSQVSTADGARAGIVDLRRRAARRKPGAKSFAALAAAEQDAILLDVEQGAFFQAMRFATMVGMFGDPAHGGNRDHVGWTLIGFEHQSSYKAPFGYYDAEAARGR